MSRQVEAFPVFDWLRFVLASVVVLGHSDVPLPGPVSPGLAVDVFLALSGWLIGGILLASKPADLPRFFFNRATRIWTPYLASMLALYAVAALREGIDANWLKYFFYDATFTHVTFTEFPKAAFEMPLQGTGNHFWSISVEEQFYLAAPLVMFLLRGGKSLPVWLAIAVALLTADSRFGPIALGVSAAVLQSRYSIADGGWKLRTAYVAVSAALFAILWQFDVQVLRSLFAVSVVLATAIPGRRSAVGLFAGAISYPLYLNQWMAGYLVHPLVKHGLPLSHAGVQIADYLIGVLIATGAWWLIDRQVMKHRAEWFTPARGRAAAIAAYCLCSIGLIGGKILKFA